MLRSVTWPALVLAITFGCAGSASTPPPPALVVYDTMQFEPTVWTLRLTNAHGQPERRITPPSLVVQVLHEGHWRHPGDMPRDHPYHRLIRPSRVLCAGLSTTLSTIALQPGETFRCIQELRDWVVWLPGRYRAHAMWIENPDPRRGYDTRRTPWVQFEVTRPGANGDALERAMQQDSPLWRAYHDFLQMPLAMQPLWIDWTVPQPPRFFVQLHQLLGGLVADVLARAVMPARLARRVEILALQVALHETRLLPPPERRERLAVVLARLARLRAELSDGDHDAPVRVEALALEIAARRGGGEHDAADAAVAALRADPAVDRMWSAHPMSQPGVSHPRAALAQILWPPVPPRRDASLGPGPSSAGAWLPPAPALRR